MRRAGILLHPTSLPGGGPAGQLGDDAIRFLDFLARTGCTLWQVLPLQPPGAGLSPYDSPSAFAIGTHLISLDRLVEEGLLEREELGEVPNHPHHVHRDALEFWHAPLVDQAAHRLAKQDPRAIEHFANTHDWARDHALYEVLRAEHHVDGWQQFPTPLANRQEDALEAAFDRFSDRVNARLAAQVIVRRQWHAIHQAARERGIEIVGDVPIFVSGGGSDVWARRHLFRGSYDNWTGGWRADPVTGVPPDYFSPTGQRWGNPHYAWEAHQADGFAWWRARIDNALALSDHVRIDHFRGFAAAWEIGADTADATQGSWGPAPGHALFSALREHLDGHLPFVAEDLGIITPDVESLRDDFGLPGMKVLQFAFGGGDAHPFLPHSYPHTNCMACTGTHDTDTAVGWYHSTDERSKHRYRVYAGRDGSEPGWDLVRLAWASAARWAVAPLQDVYNFDGSSRMNTPGTADGNWTWRAPYLDFGVADRLRTMTEAYGRLPGASVRAHPHE
jgi:4-alpha-glucanotransferase